MVIFIVVKAARMLGGALNGMRFGVPFHQHCECGEDDPVVKLRTLRDTEALSTT